MGTYLPIKLYIDNLLDDAVLSASSALLPIANLADYRPSLRWRSALLAIDPQPAVTVTLAGPSMVSDVIIWGHNISVFGQIRVRCYSNLAGTILAYDSGWIDAWEPLLGAGEGRGGVGGAGGGPTTAERAAQTPGRFLTLPSPVSAWVVRIDINDPSGADGYSQFGRLFVGAPYQPSFNFDLGGDFGYVPLGGSVLMDNGGPRFNKQPSLRQLSVSFTDLDQTEVLTTWADFQRKIGFTDALFVSALPGESVAIRQRFSFYCYVFDDGQTKGGSNLRYGLKFTNKTFMTVQSLVLREMR